MQRTVKPTVFFYIVVKFILLLVFVALTIYNLQVSSVCLYERSSKLQSVCVCVYVHFFPECTQNIDNDNNLSRVKYLKSHSTTNRHKRSNFQRFAFKF